MFVRHIQDMSEHGDCLVVGSQRLCQAALLICKLLFYGGLRFMAGVDWSGGEQGVPCQNGRFGALWGFEAGWQAQVGAGAGEAVRMAVRQTVLVSVAGPGGAQYGGAGVGFLL